jgi:hypothetical protein
MAEEEHIKGVDVHAGIAVDVGNGEEIFHLLDIEASLFLYLADNSLLACLVVVYKPARQVECPFGGILGTTDNQQFALAVQNEGSRGRTGVLIIGEPAVRTVLALDIMYLKKFAAAFGAVVENV